MVFRSFPGTNNCYTKLFLSGVPGSFYYIENNGNAVIQPYSSYWWYNSNSVCVSISWNNSEIHSVIICIFAYMKNYRNIIRINSEKRFGKPCIRDTRISVYDVLGWLASGMTNNEILKDYPELSREDIIACLAYSADREHNIQITSWTFCLIKTFRLE